ncbi:hypothetical protein D3C71_2250830 [compost metagenome]
MQGRQHLVGQQGAGGLLAEYLAGVGQETLVQGADIPLGHGHVLGLDRGAAAQ